MNPDEIFENIRNYFDEAGFNLTVKIRSQDYDVKPVRKKAGEFVHGARSIILTGFAGRGFWETFNRFLNRNEGLKKEYENPMDDYTRAVFGRLTPTLENLTGVEYRAIFPFGVEALDLDFVRLGILGGLGVPSLLGILLNPEYGTWMSLRGAIITDAEFETYDASLKDFEPCHTCDKPCISACPAHTVSESGWDWKACMMHRVSTDICSGSCASRLACPYGKGNAYTADQMAHHHEFVLKSVKKHFNDL